MPPRGAIIADSICAAGIGLVGWGLWLLHPAAAFIFGGGWLVAFALTIRRVVAQPRKPHG